MYLSINLQDERDVVQARRQLLQLVVPVPSLFDLEHLERNFQLCRLHAANEHNSDCRQNHHIDMVSVALGKL